MLSRVNMHLLTTLSISKNSSNSITYDLTNYDLIGRKVTLNIHEY